MMRKLPLLLLVGVMMLALASFVAAQDEEEAPGFAFPMLVDGETVEGEFTSSTMQIFSFVGSEGDEVSASMSATEDSETDPFIVILGPNGEVVAYNDDIDFENGDYNSAIEDAELPVDGLYLVLATSYYEMRTQTASEDEPFEGYGYELTVEGFTEPEEVTAETTQLFGFFGESDEDGAVFIEGDMTIEEGLPVAYIFFYATEGQTISISTDEAESDGLTDPMVYVFDAAGSRIAAQDDTEDGEFFPSVEVEAPDDGLYLAFVTSYGFERAEEEGDDYLGYGDVFVSLEVE
jgi:hypothetical protein